MREHTAERAEQQAAAPHRSGEQNPPGPTEPEPEGARSQAVARVR